MHYPPGFCFNPAHGKARRPLVFLPYVDIIKVAGVRLPARLYVGLRCALVGFAASLFYFVFASRIIRAASAGVFAVDSTSFASVSRKAFI